MRREWSALAAGEMAGQFFVAGDLAGAHPGEAGFDR